MRNFSYVYPLIFNLVIKSKLFLEQYSVNHNEADKRLKLLCLTRVYQYNKSITMKNFNS